MMERLTDTINGVAVYVGPGREAVGGSLPIEMSTRQVRTVLERLAAYEKSKLEPEEVRCLVERLEIVMKVNLRLLDKFGDALRAEYGQTVADTMRMINTLYREQCEAMPLPWNEYCMGKKETQP